jgi:simple sugar transport system permease protein
LAAAVSHFLLSHTVPGFEMRAVGAGAQTARFAGIRVGRSTVLSMVLGGGLAGLAGTAVILGVQYRLSDFFSSGYGFTAIAVALVGQTSPIGVVFAGLFFGGLQNGEQRPGFAGHPVGGRPVPAGPDPALHDRWAVCHPDPVASQTEDGSTCG